MPLRLAINLPRGGPWVGECPFLPPSPPFAPIEHKSKPPVSYCLVSADRLLALYYRDVRTHSRRMHAYGILLTDVKQADKTCWGVPHRLRRAHDREEDVQAALRSPLQTGDLSKWSMTNDINPRMQCMANACWYSLPRRTRRLTLPAA